ncbi:type II toxin-antitoxin system VapC family toxin [Haloarcula onubensis]|uniref:PIN domain-containing protein n=1 Tax=Haloarcula onubensis TaxID=2950539 RepID=A0ABU2FUW1_9EURY|nr:PIN domain-containing protein [Halomicroarcula sp. S3CR25-11]MDS0284538.1 PIN domain-containing protein [Halomicroarcula sp. S3CR25-11]
MSVFVDTGVFYAHHDTDASRHESGVGALNRVVESAEYGHVMTSEYVYDEVVTLTHRRTGDVSAGVEVGRRIRGEGYPDAVDLLYSSARLFQDAVKTHGRYSDHGLSFTDAMTVAMVEYHDVDAVLSFDDDFDGIVDRLAPAAVAGE